MKYMKMLGLLAVTVAAILAFAGSAQAITITEAPNDHIDVNDVVKLTSTHIQTTGTVTVTCTHSELTFTVTQAGGVHGASTTTDVRGNVTSWTWGSGSVCNSNATVTTVKPGELTLESTGANTGTLTSYEATITKLTHNILGTTHCIYKTKSTAEGGTHLGTMTDKTLIIHSAPIPEENTDGICSDDGVWHGDYTVTSPAGWDID